jgi:hypothetical protein
MRPNAPVQSRASAEWHTSFLRMMFGWSCPCRHCTRLGSSAPAQPGLQHLILDSEAEPRCVGWGWASCSERSRTGAESRNEWHKVFPYVSISRVTPIPEPYSGTFPSFISRAPSRMNR